MAPTREEMIARIQKLRPNLQAVTLKVLQTLETTPPPQESPQPWPGYLAYLQNSPMTIILQIAGNRRRYWALNLETRIYIRERLGWDGGDVEAWQYVMESTFSQRTDPPAPEGT